MAFWHVFAVLHHVFAAFTMVTGPFGVQGGAAGMLRPGARTYNALRSRPFIQTPLIQSAPRAALRVCGGPAPRYRLILCRACEPVQRDSELFARAPPVEPVVPAPSMFTVRSGLVRIV